MWSRCIKIILILIVTVQVVSCWRRTKSYGQEFQHPRRYGTNYYNRFARTAPYHTQYRTPHRYTSSYKGQPFITYNWRTHFTSPVCTSYQFPINWKVISTTATPVTDSSVPQLSRVKPTIAPGQYDPMSNGRKALPAVVTSAPAQHGDTFPQLSRVIPTRAPQVTHSPRRNRLAYLPISKQNPPYIAPVPHLPQDNEFHNEQLSTEKSFQIASGQNYLVHNEGAYPLFPRARPTKDQRMTYASVPQEDVYGKVSRETPTKDVPAMHSPSRKEGTYPAFSRETRMKIPQNTYALLPQEEVFMQVSRKVPDKDVPATHSPSPNEDAYPLFPRARPTKDQRMTYASVPQEEVFMQVSREVPDKDVPATHSPSRNEDAYPLFPRDRPNKVPSMTHSRMPQEDVFMQLPRKVPSKDALATHSPSHNEDAYPLFPRARPMNAGKSMVEPSPKQVPSTGMLANSEIVKVPILHMYDRRGRHDRDPNEDRMSSDEIFQFVHSV